MGTSSLVKMMRSVELPELAVTSQSWLLFSCAVVGEKYALARKLCYIARRSAVAISAFAKPLNTGLPSDYSEKPSGNHERLAQGVCCNSLPRGRSRDEII
jgi:hypothetical protein